MSFVNSTTILTSAFPLFCHLPIIRSESVLVAQELAIVTVTKRMAKTLNNDFINIIFGLATKAKNFLEIF